MWVNFLDVAYRDIIKTYGLVGYPRWRDQQEKLVFIKVFIDIEVYNDNIFEKLNNN